MGDVQDLWRGLSKACLSHQNHPEPGNPPAQEFSARHGTVFRPNTARNIRLRPSPRGKTVAATLHQRFEAEILRVVEPETSFAGYGKWKGAAGGCANGWLQKGLLSSKVGGLLNGMEVLSGQPDGGHGGDPGFGQVT